MHSSLQNLSGFPLHTRPFVEYWYFWPYISQIQEINLYKSKQSISDFGSGFIANVIVYILEEIKLKHLT